MAATPLPSPVSALLLACAASSPLPPPVPVEDHIVYDMRRRKRMTTNQMAHVRFLDTTHTVDKHQKMTIINLRSKLVGNLRNN